MQPAKLILALSLLAPLLPAQSTGSIVGVITNSINGAPIEGVKISAACNPDGSVRCQDASVLTNAAGEFRIPGRPDGRYFMAVQKDGFSPGLSNPTLSVVDAKEARFDVKMTPLSSLSGRVVDLDGKPVAGVAVEFRPARPVVTDAQGNFIFQNLSPSRSSLRAKVRPQPPGKDGERMVPTYYPSAINAEQAIPIEVRGADLSGYEIRLQTAQARSIRGVLLDADGTPMPHSSVTLSAPVAPSGIIPVITGVYAPLPLSAAVFLSAADGSETGDDGAFEFPAVLEGDWILKASRTGAGPANRQGAVTEIRVGRSDIDNVTVRLAKAFSIEVSSEVSDGQPSQPPRGAASLDPLDGQVAGGSGADADPPFTQHVNALPGRYLVSARSATPGYYVAAVMLDGRNVLGLVVQLAGPSDIKLVLKKDGGTVRGTVEKGEESLVVLMAEPTANARFGRSARCDKNGNFTISDLPPGTYTAVAFQDIMTLSQRDLLVRIDSAQGKRVKIEAGSIETVTLKVN